jgi:hypothetical protein
MDRRVSAGQVLVTAFGVALALAGSAWWSGRQERVRERSQLRNLLNAARVSERRLRQAVLEDSTSLAIATDCLTLLVRCLTTPCRCSFDTASGGPMHSRS